MADNARSFAEGVVSNALLNKLILNPQVVSVCDNLVLVILLFAVRPLTTSVALAGGATEGCCVTHDNEFINLSIR